MEQITEQELKGLKDLQAKQDSNAMAAGVMLLGFLESGMGLLMKTQEIRKEQNELGKLILRGHGIDPDKSDYTINMSTGQIEELTKG